MHDIASCSKQQLLHANDLESCIVAQLVGSNPQRANDLFIQLDHSWLRASRAVMVSLPTDASAAVCDTYRCN